MRKPRDIIIQPHISEKAMFDIETKNWYTFKVVLDANKPEIKKAIEEIFDVKVEKVTTNRMSGKKRRMGVHEGRRADWKKARVKLAEGDRIEIFEGM
ncbi:MULTISPECIES: 50S ribosomal protein L23 [unclassified Candidatus Frackibacter]|jgi:large subunit ribosomal protein L23|uniref:50S ribosomal protein L23 n=1 Tax=unclassified Candidatus Frackibacter TaxID=2648818 RepID=UPI000796FE2A|nr:MULTISPECIES: 50S ribosomal protein L23 [unclassified Candidatus Frackibacter]KXS45767.1 MAG: large subunit ribosomal protein L23 [Candidatus Frackibacter sp. T328-2]SDC22050.1 LSU ribosomal protein L23P [Candidatus Frackibacter sp. WG11]SEM49831.1 LSU ribosomal protein L23P [Candidatus Frackibacter sp. WG12]SFL51286.1 LSU ribosomal protein L23P [Candidatus Frackibacter sp. WG13]